MKGSHQLSRFGVKIMFFDLKLGLSFSTGTFMLDNSVNISCTKFTDALILSDFKDVLLT